MSGDLLSDGRGMSGGWIGMYLWDWLVGIGDG